MSHDEIPTSHVNDCDRMSMSQVDEIGFRLGVPLPSSMKSIAARIDLLLACERGFQRASERIGKLEKDALSISLLRSESLRLRKAELAALDKDKAIAAAEYAQHHISIHELATMLDMEEPSRMDVLHRLGEITEAGKQPDDTNSLRAELYAAKRATEEAEKRAADLALSCEERGKSIVTWQRFAEGVAGLRGERDAAIEESRTSKLLAEESRADAANLRADLLVARAEVDRLRVASNALGALQCQIQAAWEFLPASANAKRLSIDNAVRELALELDRALAELAQERLLFNRLVNALRGAK